MLNIKRAASSVALSTALLISALSAATPAVAQQIPQTGLPVVELGAGMHLIHAEVARTDEQRAIGLMARKEMAPNAGMIFVFEQPAQQCFWMRNTLIPLSAAFVADDGTIVNIVEMQPLSDASHCSTKPVRYVLEMNKGWFDKRGLKAGSKLRGGPWPK
ncbi:hypothetical protein CS062_13075 [Roseateles chitinivorans]|jgi:uncharacterized membrane protein (UPF0127 family)|uniref:DUF192 domain-containing protein n=1 Tax=Roseateles chitinivorans TaxID=2917965 RepID=A0A2G9C8F0_9BURK|nr:DUF192 domain-containing protein [Roseateles chitinivorans]PIM52698.1 hypothetical protein CS062_13075 [Roseateles chitinivorans]